MRTRDSCRICLRGIISTCLTCSPTMSRTSLRLRNLQWQRPRWSPRPWAIVTRANLLWARTRCSSSSHQQTQWPVITSNRRHRTRVARSQSYHSSDKREARPPSSVAKTRRQSLNCSKIFHRCTSPTAKLSFKSKMTQKCWFRSKTSCNVEIRTNKKSIFHLSGEAEKFARSLASYSSSRCNLRSSPKPTKATTSIVSS